MGNVLACNAVDICNIYCSNAVVSIAPPVVSQNYAVLEDHLHLVDSPENSLGGSPRRRPVTAQRLYRRRSSIVERGITLVSPCRQTLRKSLTKHI